MVVRGTVIRDGVAPGMAPARVGATVVAIMDVPTAVATGGATSVADFMEPTFVEGDTTALLYFTVAVVSMEAADSTVGVDSMAEADTANASLQEGHNGWH